LGDRQTTSYSSKFDRTITSGFVLADNPLVARVPKGRRNSAQVSLSKKR
jgi:hypothetical protein